MYNASLPQKQVQGFLLMEVMVGLLLFVGFCHVFGLYCQFCAHNQANATARLKALAIARNTLDKIIHNQENAIANSSKNDLFAVRVDKKMLSMNQNSSQLKLPPAIALEVIVSWQDEQNKTQQISLQTYSGEQA